MQTDYIESDQTLKKMIAISAAIHFVVFLFFVIKPRFQTNEALIYQSAVRVDMVGLPAKNVPEELSESVSKDPSTVPSPTKEITTKSPAPKEQAIDLKKKQSSAIEKLKALQAIEDLKKTVQEKSQKASAPIKGNVLSPGTSIRGLARGEYDSYIGSIDSHIKQNWLLPEWLAKAGHRARILVKFDERGTVLERKMVLSSGHAAYDEAAMKAVELASPFPAPPEKFVRIMAEDGIIFQFPD